MSDDLADVVRHEQEFLDPAVRGRPDLVEVLLHPDFVEFGASGRVWDRTEVVEELAERPQVSGQATDFFPTRLSADVVLVTYRISGDSSSLRSSVWVNDATTGWRLRFHQGTGLEPPRP